MKIAVFSDAFLGATGGIPTSTWGQKLELERQGHDVVLFSPAMRHDIEKVLGEVDRKKSLGDLKEQLYKQHNIVVVPSHNWLRIAKTPVSKRPEVVERFIEALYPEFDFDVVHVQYEASCSIAGMRLARKNRVPLVQTMHGREDIGIYGNVPFGLRTIVTYFINISHGHYIPHLVKVKKDNLLAPTKIRAKMWEFMVNHANYADKVITPSQHFARKLKYYGVTRPITQVSNGIFDLPELKERDFAHRELRIIWNARISHEKRFLSLLEALSLMKEPYLLSVYGDGNQLANAKRIVRERKMNVKFFGNVDNKEIFKALEKADLGILMSYGFDNQPMTILEAESIGLPVLLVDPDMKEVATDGGTILVPNENASYDPKIGTIGEAPSAKSVAKTLDDLARHPVKLKQMSNEMIKHRAEVAESVQVEKLLEVYKKAGL